MNRFLTKDPSPVENTRKMFSNFKLNTENDRSVKITPNGDRWIPIWLYFGSRDQNIAFDLWCYSNFFRVE